MSAPHLAGCRARQLEHDQFVDPDGKAVARTRCTTCGGASYVRESAPLLDGMSEAASGLLAGDEHWRELWDTDPSAVWRALTAEERRDPRLNPRHIYAESAPPGVRMRRTLNR